MIPFRVCLGTFACGWKHWGIAGRDGRYWFVGLRYWAITKEPTAPFLRSETMTTDEIEKKARELLAGTYDKAGMHTRAACLRGTYGPLDAHDKAALSAVEAAVREVEALRIARDREADNATAALALLSRMRFACGDNGTRMQDELEAYLRGLRADAERLDALEALVNEQPDMALLLHHGMHIVRSGERFYAGIGLSNTRRSLRQAIDQARGKAGGEVG